MINGKRGAIELSITTIVVVVIGVTLLALGLAWVSGIFEKLQGTTKGAFEKADAEISNIFAGGSQDNPFRLSPTSISIKQGDRGKATIIVANLGGKPSVDKIVVSVSDTLVDNRVNQNLDLSKVSCFLGDTIKKQSNSYGLKSGQELKVTAYIDVDKDAQLGDYICNFNIDSDKLSELAGNSGQVGFESLNIHITK